MSDTTELQALFEQAAEYPVDAIPEDIMDGIIEHELWMNSDAVTLARVRAFSQSIPENRERLKLLYDMLNQKKSEFDASIESDIRAISRELTEHLKGISE